MYLSWWTSKAGGEYFLNGIIKVYGSVWYGWAWNQLRVCMEYGAEGTIEDEREGVIIYATVGDRMFRKLGVLAEGTRDDEEQQEASLCTNPYYSRLVQDESIDIGASNYIDTWNNKAQIQFIRPFKNEDTNYQTEIIPNTNYKFHLSYYVGLDNGVSEGYVHGDKVPGTDDP